MIELSCQLGLRRAALHARWIPRLQNEEADALTNSDFRHFDPKLRIPVDVDQLGFKVLPMLFETGELYVRELEATRKAIKDKADEDRKKGFARKEGKARKLGCESLRERDPW